MSDLLLLSERQMARISPHFPLSHGVARVDDQRVVSGSSMLSFGRWGGCRPPKRHCNVPSNIRKFSLVQLLMACGADRCGAPLPPSYPAEARSTNRNILNTLARLNPSSSAMQSADFPAASNSSTSCALRVHMSTDATFFGKASFSAARSATEVWAHSTLTEVITCSIVSLRDHNQ